MHAIADGKDAVLFPNEDVHYSKSPGLLCLCYKFREYLNNTMCPQIIM